VLFVPHAAGLALWLALGMLPTLAADVPAIHDQYLARAPGSQLAQRDANISRLSPREREVLAEIAQGRTNPAISQSLVISQHAVEKHINSIFTKLGLTGDRSSHPRVRATLMYRAEGRH